MEKEPLKIQISYDTDLISIRHPTDMKQSVVVPFSPLLEALRECGYQIAKPPSLFYNEVKAYILSTWPKSLMIVDTGTIISANNGHLDIYFQNGHLDIYFQHEPGSTPFLVIRKGRNIVFNGYLRTVEDFKTILELTSVQKP